MKVVLVSPYEIGRQPFALAEPAAWLNRDGFKVTCIDLANQPFDEAQFFDVRLVAIHLIMHAGARLAAELIPAIAAANPQTSILVYGLYASVNADYFRSLGCEYVFGGESEADLLSLCRVLRDGQDTEEFRTTRQSLNKLNFVTPDRSGLPALNQYTSLQMRDGTQKTVGFAETTRGCKHLCRHCPIVPVYAGVFRVISPDVVMADIHQQLAAGAQHISFGDPDFLNGPGHAWRIIRRFQDECPGVTWDATIKIEHLLKHPSQIEKFADNHCLFITSAVESIEDFVLQKLAKGHTAEDFYQALEFLHTLDITMLPTFVPFTPWTTMAGYLRLLKKIVHLKLVNSIAPVQLSIRLLLPKGTRLLQYDNGQNEWLREFDAAKLGYQWVHTNPVLDQLQIRVQQWVMEAEQQDLDRQSIFQGIWDLAHHTGGVEIPELVLGNQPHAPQMSEPWYCCAEPTALQQANLSAVTLPAV